MTATLWPSGPIVVTMDPKEYDIFCQALLLMELAGLGVEKDTEKLKRLEAMQTASKNLTIKKS